MSKSPQPHARDSLWREAYGVRPACWRFKGQPLPPRRIRSHTPPVFAWLLFFLFSGCFAFSQAVNPTASAPSTRYETRAEHDPNGIGKFYMGREIALVMGHQAADWLERPERDEEERPGLLLDALMIKPGDVVADIGAGSGYFTRRLSKLVAENGLVYAVDIQQEMLDLLTNKM